MIDLGCHDTDVPQEQCTAYRQRVERITRVPMSDVHDSGDKLNFKPYAPDTRQPMSVRQMQQALTAIGVFPGGQADGICGYRTLSALRLFQEYVRTVDKRPCLPDGRFGPQSRGHLQRWLGSGKQIAWTGTIARWQAGDFAQTEYAAWLSLLDKVKQKYRAAPDRMLQLVNDFTGATDTRKTTEWDFAPGHIHLLAIRRDEFSGKFDDVFILLIKGLVFKFQGSTEPGASNNPNGTPFLVRGQHDYHFGWHQRRYLALRPRRLNQGVLIVRSRDNKRLEDHDLDNGLEANATINIHWGGKGLKFDINKWSEGCQVINGSLYLNHAGDLVDCSTFVGRNNTEVAHLPAKTRAAYNVLLDLVSALSGDTSSSTVKYTLLAEQDLELDPALQQAMADARVAVTTRFD